MSPRAAVATTGLLVATALAACGGGDATGTGALSLLVEPTLDTITSLGASSSFGAQVQDDQGRVVTDAVVSWSTSPAGVVTLSSDTGRAILATAVAPGSTRIVASVAGVSRQATVVVRQVASTSFRFSGEGQSAPAGTTLPTPLGVKVTDAGGSGIAGVPVSWTAGAGTIAPGTTSTGPDGVARGTWTLGPSAGIQTARAAVPGLLEDVTFTANATAAGWGGVSLSRSRSRLRTR